MDIDKAAMISAMNMQIKSQIIGIFGEADANECIAKLHSILELAGVLQVKDFKISISLKELQDAQAEYIKLDMDEEDVE